MDYSIPDYPSRSSWVPPCSGEIKINCVAAFNPNLSLLLEIIQALLHVDGDAFMFNCDRLELAEFKAISSRIGMQNLCLCSSFSIESDCRSIVDAVMSADFNSSWDHSGA